MANPPPNRPSYIDIRTASSSNVARPMRSPRLHVAGEIPPELSPLDAFAMQSRLLARQLEESVTKDGNRVSRLPPLTISSPLIVQGRSDYFRSMSQEASPETEIHHTASPPSAGLGLRTAEVEDAFAAADRPMSMHPRMSRIPPTPDDHMSMPMPTPLSVLTASPAGSPFGSARGRTLGQIDEGEAYFGARREQSPGQLETGDGAPLKRETSLTLPSPTPRGRHASPDSISRQNSGESSALLPPRPMFQPRRPSSQSVTSMSPHEGPDEMAAMSSSIHSLPPRKMSSASGTFSPAFNMHRSPSVASDSSALPRPSFNFSRPISRSGTPTMEPHMPLRQASSDSQPSFLAEDVATPISIQSEGFGNPDDPNGAQSYIYSKFALPRGKSVQRTVPLDRSATADVASPSSTTSNPAALLAAPPSPPTRPSTSSGRLEDDDEDRQRGRTPVSAAHDPPRLLTANSATTAASSRTLKAARSQHSFGQSVSDMSAEEHLAKGIQCHEKGSLNESTYHLRHAAKMNNPTAMLLYALACRHGWGMRPNQSEGVQWLKKAAEFASVEIADDEGLAKQGKHVDKLDSKTHKAQFALSIYELGVSHMNGWGIEQDKTLALRCFEIAGSWGDIDALAEAGFCYAKGVGCKKDLKKSAKFYRQAEAKGMSMIGNSWIHKSKYDEADGDGKKKRGRSKSRTRTMFGRIGGS